MQTEAAQNAHRAVSHALPLRGEAPPSDPVRRGEMALPERRRQDGGVVRVYEPEAPNSRVMIVKHRARCECMLDRYRLRRKISMEQFEAGMRFRQAWLYHAEGIKTRDSTSARFEGSGYGNPLDALSEAERTICEAYSILSPMQALVIVSVCGAGDAAGTDKRMAILRRALNILADKWDL